MKKAVTASVAKQSMVPSAAPWIATLRSRVDDGGGQLFINLTHCRAVPAGLYLPGLAGRLGHPYPAPMKDFLRAALAIAAWPGLLVLCIAATAAGFAGHVPVITFNLTYLGLATILLWLERIMPHERDWTKPDGQIGADLLHTLVSTGSIQALIALSGVIGLASLVQPGPGLWPADWPLPFQIVLGLAVSEFAAYWAHRIAHEWRPLWPFHAVHHSVEKLWIVNSGRFHVVDALKSVVPGALILLAAGAPAGVLAWLSALTGYIGIMTHCNIAMRFGPLSLVFNTPELHRWHHSRDLREGNKNYGENIMLWDWVFGTYFNANRRPPVSIGIAEPMPAQFRDQLIWPFRQSGRASHMPAPEEAGVALE